MSPELRARLTTVPRLSFSPDGTQVIFPIYLAEGQGLKVFDVTPGPYSIPNLKTSRRRFTHFVMGVPYADFGFLLVPDLRILAVYDPPITLKEFLTQCSDT